MTDLYPRYERTLPADVKERMRATLIEQASEQAAEPTPTKARRWLMPAVAAAAVAAVVGGGVLMDGATPPQPVSPVDDAAGPPKVDPVESCRESAKLINPKERGLIQHHGETMVLMMAGRNFAICYQGFTYQSVLPPKSEPRPEPGLWDLGTNLGGINENGAKPGRFDEYTIFGVVPVAGVTAISYTFDDGHTEPAAIDGRLFFVAYLTDKTVKPVAMRVTTAAGTNRYQLRQGGRDR